MTAKLDAKTCCHRPIYRQNPVYRQLSNSAMTLRPFRTTNLAILTFPNMPRKVAATAAPRSIVVIPARYGSTPLPHKMLLRQTGKTLLQHTFEAAVAAKRPAGVLVATDHAEIATEVERFRGEFMMTSADCQSGTDRVAEVARTMPGVDILVNVQGDEPE